jgi:tetratricopeptide (TPR) repeat protein
MSERLMARGSICAALVVVLALAPGVLAKTMDDYITEATGYQRAGDLARAVEVIETALKEHPDNAAGYAHLGFYKGMQAGATQNFMEAATLSSESFAMLDKAVALDSLSVDARYYRGLMGVKVPEFLGKLDGALADLELVLKIRDKSPESVPDGIVVSAYSLLGEGYQKKGNTAKATEAWEAVTRLAPGTQTAKAAEANLAKATETPVTPPAPPQSSPGQSSPLPAGDTADLLGQAQAAMDKGDYLAAEKILRQVIGVDSTNTRAYTMLGSALAFADRGYDERIAEDTTLRTNLVFEAMKYFDKAVSLAPNDTEARLMRGIMGVSFPFFVGKLDQGIEDLRIVAESSAPASTKAQAEYWLGFGYQKKGMTYWTKIVNDNPDEAVVRMALDGMRPHIEHFDRAKYPGPVVVVDFVLGFRDELAPQTAVWVETDKGDFVRTIYVSGFSGHAKGVQIVLPEWARRSAFADADAVTGASIDFGHHVHVWDLKDTAGKDVRPGNYVIKVEASYWPSMKYQVASAAVEVGKQENRKAVEEGNYIPYLEVKYLP